MSNVTQKRQTLVKARKAARVVFALLLFTGAVLFLLGIFMLYLPVVLDGIVGFASSLMALVVSKIAEKKLNELGV